MLSYTCFKWPNDTFSSQILWPPNTKQESNGWCSFVTISVGKINYHQLMFKMWIIKVINFTFKTNLKWESINILIIWFSFMNVSSFMYYLHALQILFSSLVFPTLASKNAIYRTPVLNDPSQLRWPQPPNKWRPIAQRKRKQIAI